MKRISKPKRIEANTYNWFCYFSFEMTSSLASSVSCITLRLISSSGVRARPLSARLTNSRVRSSPCSSMCSSSSPASYIASRSWLRNWRGPSSKICSYSSMFKAQLVTPSISSSYSSDSLSFWAHSYWRSFSFSRPSLASSVLSSSWLFKSLISSCITLCTYACYSCLVIRARSCTLIAWISFDI